MGKQTPLRFRLGTSELLDTPLKISGFRQEPHIDDSTLLGPQKNISVLTLLLPRLCRNEQRRTTADASTHNSAHKPDEGASDDLFHAVEARTESPAAATDERVKCR